MSTARAHRWWQVTRVIALLVLGMSAFALFAHARAAAEAESVHAVKAAFLMRFGEYVDWPAEHVFTPEATIAVIGAPEVAAELRRMAPGRSVQGKPIAIAELRTLQQVRGHEYMLYVGEAARPAARQSLQIVTERHQPVLVVADWQGALEDGAMINFIVHDQLVRFEVSVETARAAGLRPSSRLLAVAERVVGMDSLRDEDAPTL
ncbi:MAG: YfiR family protein [Steroidobacteraceae bacterium]|nr:YfiR family protein [Steroidobacteraceae bacterium]